jgi:hypothetical protein
MQLYYGSEYFLGNVKTMKEDIINYVSNLMQDKGYQIVNNNILIERVYKDTNKKIPKFEQELYKIQITNIPSKNNINNNDNSGNGDKEEKEINTQKCINLNIETHNNDEIKNIFGCKCGFNAKNQKQLTKHTNRCFDSSDINNESKCNKCKKIFITKYNRDRHYKKCKIILELNDDQFILGNDSLINEIEKDFLLMKSFQFAYKTANQNEKKIYLQQGLFYENYKNLINKYKNLLNTD